MSNMSYCRFSNTVIDLKDCIENFEDFDYDEANEEERKGYLNFIKLIIDFNNNYELKSLLAYMKHINKDK